MRLSSYRLLVHKGVAADNLPINRSTRSGIDLDCLSQQYIRCSARASSVRNM
jgi:hypothetical protein